MKEVKGWSKRQLKKARWKKSLARARKRGTVFESYVTITEVQKLASSSGIEGMIVEAFLRQIRDSTQEVKR